MSFLKSLFGGGDKQDTTYKSASKDKLDAAAGLNIDDLSGVAQGGGTLADILAAAKATGNQDAAMLALSDSVGGGSALANQQVMENPLLSGLLGEGGSLDKASAEEQRLAGAGFSLQPEDYEAYGQASGNIARDFGTQEASLAQALAARGMSNSGAAGAGFSNLYGNKFEQLGQLQRKVADDRMKTNMDRLQQTRSYMTQLGGMGLQAQGQQFNQNQAERQNLQQQQSLDTSAYSAEKQAEATAIENEGHGLLDAVTGGLMSGVSGGISGILGTGANKLAGSMFGGAAAKPKSNVAGAASTKAGSIA